MIEAAAKACTPNDRESPLILASASATRAGLLRRAGLGFRQCPAALDEAALRIELRAMGIQAGPAALALAEGKAQAISRAEPGALVIGADQILECGGQWYEKPADQDQARRQLRALRNRWHRLHAGVAVASAGDVLWHHVESADLAFRDFSDAALEVYLTRAGDEIQGSVGAYRIEGEAVQLFAAVAGDWFTILGLPLLPLLSFLRERGAVAS